MQSYDCAEEKSMFSRLLQPASVVDFTAWMTTTGRCVKATPEVLFRRTWRQARGFQREHLEDPAIKRRTLHTHPFSLGATMNSTILFRGLAFLLSLICFLGVAHAQSEIVGFDSDKWTFINAKTVEHLGRKALMGSAYLKGANFRDGVIEVDMAIERKTSYPGVTFRMASLRDYERFYIRPHRAGIFADALQYVASFNGVDSWQLYNGPGKTTGLEIPYQQWFHIKLEVKGNQARIFVNNSPQPALFIVDLQHGSSEGMIGLMGPTDGTAYFSNFSYRNHEPLDFPAPSPKDSPLGIISDWEVSQVFKVNEIDIEQTPDDCLFDIR